MKKTKENWIGEQCREIEENLRKNYSKKAYQLVKDLTTVKHGKATIVQYGWGKCLTDEREILNRWTEYCTELYNHKTNGDPSVLDCPQTDTEDDHPTLRKEVEAAVQSLKKGKSAGVDNIPAELVRAGGEDVITAFTTTCNKIWQTAEWQTPCTQSLVITLPKKGNLQQCQDYWTISLISHPSTVMLKSILNSIEATSGEDNRRRTGRLQGRKEPTEQTFNLRILCEKYVQHQQDLYHVFIDFKAFDRVWHAGLWAIMKKYMISTKLIRVIKTSMTRPLVQSSSTAA